MALASRHGSTAGIAQRLGDVLSDARHEATVRPLTEAGDPSGYDAVVLGSSTYLGRWPKDAMTYVRRHLQSLARLPVWLFSSGPIGDAEVDEGPDLLGTSAPKELPELQESIRPEEHRVFFGALDPGHLTLPERALRVLPAGRAMLPAGDFRDWADIEARAARIADHLAPPGNDAASDRARPR